MVDGVAIGFLMGGIVIMISTVVYPRLDPKWQFLKLNFVSLIGFFLIGLGFSSGAFPEGASFGAIAFYTGMFLAIGGAVFARRIEQL